jgi:hypothetical protein
VKSEAAGEGFAAGHSVAGGAIGRYYEIFAASN